MKKENEFSYAAKCKLVYSKLYATLPLWKRQCVDEGDERHGREIAKRVAAIVEDDKQWEQFLAGFVKTEKGILWTFKKPKRESRREKRKNATERKFEALIDMAKSQSETTQDEPEEPWAKKIKVSQKEIDKMRKEDVEWQVELMEKMGIETLEEFDNMLDSMVEEKNDEGDEYMDEPDWKGEKE